MRQVIGISRGATSGEISVPGVEDIFDEVVTAGPSTGATHLGKGCREQFRTRILHHRQGDCRPRLELDEEIGEPLHWLARFLGVLCV